MTTNTSEPLYTSVLPIPDCSSTCLTSFLFLFAAIPDSQARIPGGKLDNEDVRNIIPEPAVTPPPSIRQQPFDYDGDVYIGFNNEGRKVEKVFEDEEEEEDEEGEEDEENQLNPRGDVFSKSVLGVILMSAGESEYN